MAMEYSELGNRQSGVMLLLCILPKSFLRSNIKLSCVLKCTALNEGKSTVVRALQLGAATDVCPDGKWVTFLCLYLARVRACHLCLEHLLFLDEQKAVFTMDRNFLFFMRKPCYVLFSPILSAPKVHFVVWLTSLPHVVVIGWTFLWASSLHSFYSISWVLSLKGAKMSQGCPLSWPLQVLHLDVWSRLFHSSLPRRMEGTCFLTYIAPSAWTICHHLPWHKFHTRNACNSTLTLKGPGVCLYREHEDLYSF